MTSHSVKKTKPKHQNIAIVQILSAERFFEHAITALSRACNLHYVKGHRNALVLVRDLAEVPVQHLGWHLHIWKLPLDHLFWVYSSRPTDLEKSFNTELSFNWQECKHSTST